MLTSGIVFNNVAMFTMAWFQRCSNNVTMFAMIIEIWTQTKRETKCFPDLGSTQTSHSGSFFLSLPAYFIYFVTSLIKHLYFILGSIICTYIFLYSRHLYGLFNVYMYENKFACHWVELLWQLIHVIKFRSKICLKCRRGI